MSSPKEEVKAAPHDGNDKSNLEETCVKTEGGDSELSETTSGISEGDRKEESSDKSLSAATSLGALIDSLTANETCEKGSLTRGETESVHAPGKGDASVTIGMNGKIMIILSSGETTKNHV